MTKISSCLGALGPRKCQAYGSLDKNNQQSISEKKSSNKGKLTIT